MRPDGSLDADDAGLEPPRLKRQATPG
jgi:hypothetical protein